MSVNQISIFLENKPGTLFEMTKVLDDNNVNIRALSLSETEGFGIVRIIVGNVYEAQSVLRDAGYVYRVIPVVIAAVPDEPGGLNHILDILQKANVNIEYMYSMLDKGVADSALMILRVSNVEKAEIALDRENIRTVSKEEIASL